MLVFGSRPSTALQALRINSAAETRRGEDKGHFANAPPIFRPSSAHEGRRAAKPLRASAAPREPIFLVLKGCE
jgi:hypothetical protein